MLKIGIIKPDYKIRGGYEIVVERLVEELRKFGYFSEIVAVDATRQTLDHIPYPVSDEEYSLNPEFFRYIDNYWKYLTMDLSQFDMVISTQPPTFAVNHKKHLSLFYHHMKIYYDLNELIQEVGLNRPFHEKASQIVREIDTISLSKVLKILAGSQHIKERIGRYNRISDNVDVVYAGISKDFYNYDGEINYQFPIVVGRHEFPKRPELFVAAMKKLPRLMGKVIGEGGRTDDLKKIDSILTYAHHKGIYIPDDVVWKKMSNGFYDEAHETLWIDSKKQSYQSNVIFTGRVSKKQLIEEYANALCVVCPAFEEDYGLTAIEAMAFKKPVIACQDGGGYTELIKHGVNGFIVEPTSDAIAEAIRQFAESPELAVKMGRNGYEFSRKFTWQNTMAVILEEIEKIV